MSSFGNKKDDEELREGEPREKRVRPPATPPTELSKNGEEDKKEEMAPPGGDADSRREMLQGFVAHLESLKAMQVARSEADVPYIARLNEAIDRLRARIEAIVDDPTAETVVIEKIIVTAAVAAIFNAPQPSMPVTRDYVPETRDLVAPPPETALERPPWDAPAMPYAHMDDLTRLKHAKRCRAHLGIPSRDPGLCRAACTAPMRALMEHMPICGDNADCIYPDCATATRLLNEHSNCIASRNINCRRCGSMVRIHMRIQRAQLITIMAEQQEAEEEAEEEEEQQDEEQEN